MPESKRKLMTQQECADELGCHKNTIGKYLDRGELKYLFIGGQRRISKELWEEFLESRTFSGALVEVDDES